VAAVEQAMKLQAIRLRAMAKDLKANFRLAIIEEGHLRRWPGFLRNLKHEMAATIYQTTQ
jgi:hypothetical protein